MLKQGKSVSQQVKISLEIDVLKNWFDHPVTKIILNELANRQEREQTNFLKIPLDSEPYVIERRLYKLAGRTEIMRQIQDYEWIKEVLLEDRVEWIAK